MHARTRILHAIFCLHVHASIWAKCMHAKGCNTGKTPCKYGPVFAPYLHDWTLYGINTVQKWIRIYMAFFLCKLHVNICLHVCAHNLHSFCLQFTCILQLLAYINL